MRIAEDDRAPERRRLRRGVAVAALLSIPLLTAHVLFFWVGVPTFGGLFETLGGEAPRLTRMLFAPAAGGVALALDVGLFAGCAWIAGRRHPGALIVPPLAYLGFGALLVWTLFAPLTELLEASFR